MFSSALLGWLDCLLARLRKKSMQRWQVGCELDFDIGDMYLGLGRLD